MTLVAVTVDTGGETTVVVLYTTPGILEATGEGGVND